MYCFVSCQSNRGHVASTSLWARYLSFFALICPNYFGFFTTITHKEPNCFLRDVSLTWNHQYALSLREKLSICYHIITSSSHEKAAAAVFSKISHFMFRVMERLMSFLFSFFSCKMIYWRKTGILRSSPTIQCGNDSHYTFCHGVTQGIFYSSFSWSDMQLLSTT